MFPIFLSILRHLFLVQLTKYQISFVNNLFLPVIFVLRIYELCPCMGFGRCDNCSLDCSVRHRILITYNEVTRYALQIFLRAIKKTV